MFNFFKKKQTLEKEKENFSKVLDNGIEFFNNSNMSEAQIIFEEILSKDFKNKKAQIYLLKIYNHFVKVYSKSGEVEKMNQYFDKLDEIRNASRKSI
ncbi:MAG: hypothetical protein ACRCZ2_08010 [Fusobacteriaceae bacterium]